VAKALSIDIQGLSKTISQLRAAGDSRLNEVDMEMAAGTEMMATVAKKIFYADNPEIRASIRSNKVRPFVYELAAGYGDDPMAAYIEFGTGKYFPQYPGKEASWQALAREYFVNGEGWMRPAPYFYPSVMSGLVSLQSNIKQVLERDERL
jgi:hypothetical protein